MKSFVKLPLEILLIGWLGSNWEGVGEPKKKKGLDYYD